MVEFFTILETIKLGKVMDESRRDRKRKFIKNKFQNLGEGKIDSRLRKERKALKRKLNKLDRRDVKRDLKDEDF